MNIFQFQILIFFFQCLLQISFGHSQFLTPLFHKNSTACIAENLRRTHRYVCDADANVFCINGWKNPEKNCLEPICDFNGAGGCVHGECVIPNVCICESGWDGPRCDQCIPLGGCKMGTCTKPMDCNCKFGWKGPFCQEAECHNCVNGRCHEPNKCICDYGWQGHNCSECMTLPNCNHGKCVDQPFQCECDAGWDGLGCSQPVCRDGCHSEHGECNKPGECICKQGWGGRNCDKCLPYPGCKGTCIHDVPWTCSDLGDDHPSKPDEWSEWTEWSGCSQTCGEGLQKRERKCFGTSEHHVGDCVGESMESRECIDRYCSVDGNWGSWGKWSGCSSSCGTGLRSRSRLCNKPAPKYGGNVCIGLDKEVLKCFSRACPVNGKWSSWKKWSNCDQSCGNGVKSRQRICDAPPAAHGGRPCFGKKLDTISCAHGPCPVDGKWSFWTHWTHCSKTCGKGTKSRRRECIEPLFGGKPCQLDSTGADETQPCILQDNCAINGQWGQWTPWTKCSETCGEGNQMRERLCNKPAPKFGGRLCQGLGWTQKKCSIANCAQDGKWLEWNQWTDCSNSCGSGTQKRKRICDGPKFGGRPCFGEEMNTRKCFSQSKFCPIDGSWEQWGQWSRCSHTCGSGTKTSKRVCKSPQFGGLPCKGDNIKKQDCNLQECFMHGKWSFWNQWSSCSKSCGNGLKRRTRECESPIRKFGRNIIPCSGPRFEEIKCFERNCATNGNWGQWGQWTDCTVSCGSGGTKRRERFCNYPAPSNGGRFCTGLSRSIEACSQNKPCPIDGGFTLWTVWSECTVECFGDRGDHVRRRSCTNPKPQFGGKDCNGEIKEKKYCTGKIAKQNKDKNSRCFHISE